MKVLDVDGWKHPKNAHTLCENGPEVLEFGIMRAGYQVYIRGQHYHVIGGQC